MKKLFITVFLFGSMTSVVAQTQNEFYLDFYGARYKLKKDPKTRYVDNTYGDELLRTTDKKFHYTLTGRSFLTKTEKQFPIDPANPALVKRQTSFQFSDSITIEDIIDSVNLKKIDFNKNFEVHLGNDILTIYHFKLFSDESSYEIEFVNGDKELAVNSIADNLKEYFEKLKSDSLVIITDIYFYSSRTKNIYHMDFSILLRK